MEFGSVGLCGGWISGESGENSLRTQCQCSYISIGMQNHPESVKQNHQTKIRLVLLTLASSLWSCCGSGAGGGIS